MLLQNDNDTATMIQHNEVDAATCRPVWQMEEPHRRFIRTVSADELVA